MTYILNITTDVKPYQHDSHLGTDVKIAMSYAEEVFHKRIPKVGTKILCVKMFNDYVTLMYNENGWYIFDSHEGWKIFSK
jgi:hypothetical protein